MSDLAQLVRFFPDAIRSIAVAAPSSPSADPAATTRQLAALAAAGFRIHLTANARLGEPGDAYSAIDASLRARDLEEAWLDPAVQLILPVRGGGGGRDLVEALDWEKLATRPSMAVLGFSDLTLLHAAMVAKGIGRPVTAPMLEEIPGATADSIEAGRLALAGLPHPPYRLRVLRRGEAKGPLFGAHLQRLASLLGSRWFPDLAGRILFLECPHRTEREIVPLFRDLVGSGCLDAVAAIVFGRFPDCTSPEAETRLLEELAGFVRRPVLSGFPFGHTPALHAIDSAASGVISPDGVLSIRPGPPVGG